VTGPLRSISVAFFASGAASLIFEIVWFHRLGLVLGNGVAATNIVLASFMAGLAVGSAGARAFGQRVSRFLHAYAYLEAIVALAGIGVTVGVVHLVGVIGITTRALADSSWLVNVVRSATAFLVLVVPTAAMGASLPMLVAALSRNEAGFGRVLGQLYGWNTLGAVSGSMAAELVLIPRFGVIGTGWIAAALSGAASAVAFCISGRLSVASAQGAREAAPRVASSDSAWLLTAAFAAGACLMALEVVWIRFLSLFVIATTLAAALMVAIVLTGIGIGGLVGSMWLERRPHAHLQLATVSLTGCIVTLLAYEAFQLLDPAPRTTDSLRILWMAAAITFPTSIVSGTMFTLLGQALKLRIVSETATVGSLVLANVTGAACGALTATLVLLPRLGIEASLFLLSLVYAITGGVLIRSSWAAKSRRRIQLSWWALVVALVVIATFPFGLISSGYFPRVVAPWASDGAKLIATADGPYETIFLLKRDWLGQPLYHRLVTNGFSMSGTSLSARRYMKYFVYWPAVLKGGHLHRVLVICYGVGATVQAATEAPSVAAIDVAEISASVVRMSDVIYPHDKNPLRDARVHLHLEDGRQFLQTTPQRFDLITGEPPPPPVAGTPNLYSSEYFRLMYDHLTEGGLVTYWLPVGRTDGYDTSAVIRAFCEAFEDCSLWNATPFDFMLVGTRHLNPPEAATFSEPWASGEFGLRLREVGFELPEQVGATFLGDAAYLKSLAGDALPVTDNYPKRILASAEHLSLADARYGSNAQVMENFRQVLDPSRARRRFATSPFIQRLWPHAMARQTLPFFEHQGLINRVLSEGPNPLRYIEELHHTLADTPLRRLPLWMVGSDDVQQNIAETAEDSVGGVDYVLGLRALVARNFTAAVALFANADSHGLGDANTRPLLAYSLCLAGELNRAAVVAADTTADTTDARHFWKWLAAEFTLPSAPARR
jgi:spermidine synthase